MQDTTTIALSGVAAPYPADARHSAATQSTPISARTTGAKPGT